MLILNTFSGFGGRGRRGPPLGAMPTGLKYWMAPRYWESWNGSGTVGNAVPGAVAPYAASWNLMNMTFAGRIDGQSSADCFVGTAASSSIFHAPLSESDRLDAGWHKDNAAFTIAMTLHLNGSDTSKRILCTMNEITMPATSGILLYKNPQNKLYCFIGNGSGTFSLNVSTDNNFVPSNAWVFLGLSINEAAGTGFFYCNGQQSTFAATYSTPSTAAPYRRLGVGDAGANGYDLGVGDRVGDILIADTAWTKAQMDQAFATVRTVWGI